MIPDIPWYITAIILIANIAAASGFGSSSPPRPAGAV